MIQNNVLYEDQTFTVFKRLILFLFNQVILYVFQFFNMKYY